DDKNIEYDEDKNEFLIYEIGNNEGDIFVVEMGINTRTEKIEHFNVPKIIPDTEYQRMMRGLNYSQRKYTLNVMNLIKNGDKESFYFINGGAGVGKSTLIKAVYQSILRFYNSLPGSNPETNRAALCAPTGKAATLIDGMTLHSFLSLPNWSEIERLAIINNRRNINGWFHNVSTCQCALAANSVNKETIWWDISHSFRRFQSIKTIDNPLWSLFELFELTEIMRQKDDKSFAIALSNIAKETMTLEDINLLKSRIVLTENLEMIEDAIMIFRSNAEFDAYNTKVLASLNTEGATANAYDFCVGDELASIK
ncbi:unnamed protein product, partial [Rotaria socialis]